MSASTFVKPGSLRRSIFLMAATLGLAAGSSGCWVVGDNDGGPEPGTVGTVEEESIDTGATVDVVAGSGAGVYVEYAGAGAWSVSTTCDTKVAPEDGACAYDIVISTTDAAGFASPQGVDLGPDDSVTLEPDGTLHLVFETTTGTDGVTFSASPGATVRVDAQLANASASAVVDWVQNGVVQNGVQASAIDFTPTNP
jgi:hypothetical protein